MPRPSPGATITQLIDSTQFCSLGHPVWVASEGYAICQGAAGWHAWSLSKPIAAPEWWETGERSRHYIGRKSAWCSEYPESQEFVLELIEADMAAHRELPFDEDRERSRLVAI